MSSLTNIDKKYLETLLEMESGYVLDFSNKTFYEFINSVANIDINDSKYQIYGSSKANRLRAFWSIENDNINSAVLRDLLKYYKFNVDNGKIKFNEKIYNECIRIVNRLSGENQINTEDDLLKIKFENIDIKNLPLSIGLDKILENRIEEIDKCLGFGAYLSVVILCGSILECLLLNFMLVNPEAFNRYAKSPKDKEGKVKQFNDWKLTEMLDASGGLGFLSQDTQRFSHELRNFRNYVHPMEQLAYGFKPDEQTAKVAFQVLKMAVLDLQRKRDTKFK